MDVKKWGTSRGIKWHIKWRKNASDYITVSVASIWGHCITVISAVYTKKLLMYCPLNSQKYQIYLVIAGNIFVKSSEHDHGYHARQKKNDDKRIENAKPLYICMWHWLQDVVPSWWPFDCVIHLKQNIPPAMILYFYIALILLCKKIYVFKL
jgi:hypothetical protein